MCVQFVYPQYVCAYICTHVCIYAHIHACSYVPMGLPHKSEMLEFPSPWKPESCHIVLLLFKLDKLKLSGFIRKKWIFAISHCICYFLFLAAQQTLLSWVFADESSFWERHDGSLFDWSDSGRSCYLFLTCLGLLKKTHSYFVFSESWVYLITLTRIIYGNYWMPCIVKVTHNKKVGLAELRLRIARILAGCVVP